MPIPEVKMIDRLTGKIERGVMMFGGRLTDSDINGERSLYLTQDDPEVWTPNLWTVHASRPVPSASIWSVQRHNEPHRATLISHDQIPFPITGCSNWKRAIVRITR